MHEFAVAEALLLQVLAETAPTRGRVDRIMLRLGPLAGIEPGQLCRAFALVAAGTPCDSAIIETEQLPVQVSCRICRSASQPPANRLLCGKCGAWQVDLVSGDEMLLAWIETASEEMHV